MPGGLQDVELIPGVNVQKTLADNQAGVSVSQLIRYKEGRIQKLGGWAPYYAYPLCNGPVRDLWAFAGIPLESKIIGFGSSDRLGVISSGQLIDITPQYFRSNPTPTFSVSSGSNVCTIGDPGSSMSAYGAIRLDTPIAIGGLVLSGMYDVQSVLDSNTYTILSSTPFLATSSQGVLPTFKTTAGSPVVDVFLSGNNYLAQLGLLYPFGSSFAPTNVGGLSIYGGYQVNAIVDSTNFQIAAAGPATTSSGPVAMNGGKASIYHYVVLGPPATQGAYGAGLYGANLYGIGTAVPSGTGTPVAADDWQLDNWAQGYLTACMKDDAIYYWAPNLSLGNATPMVANGAPPYSRGAFVSIGQEMMFAWGTSTYSGGWQDLLLVRWSDTGAQNGFNEWRPLSSTFAGSFKLPNGSAIRCGLHAPLYALFWTDVDVWAASYVGQPVVWSFQQMGMGCGALGPHCAGVLGGVTYWASITNFYMLGPGGVQVLPCGVWDFFFQQLDQTNMKKVRCAVNSAFNEISWEFPVIGGNGENQAYVKLHIGEGQEYEWDYGFRNRTAWIDVTAVGMPLGTDQNQMLMQHEISPDAANTALNSSFETGYFTIGDGTNLAFIDWVLPDAKWSVYGGTPGTLLFTFFVADYAGQPERTYGPYPVTKGWPYINPRMRGRFFRMRVESQDLGTFWRVGKVKFRWAPAGSR